MMLDIERSLLLEKFEQFLFSKLSIYLQIFGCGLNLVAATCLAGPEYYIESH